MSDDFEYIPRFKVGDRVLISKDCEAIEPNNWTPSMGFYQGIVATITSVSKFSGGRINGGGHMTCPVYTLDKCGGWEWMDPWLSKFGKKIKIDADGNLS